MITKRELEEVLGQMNAIFKQYDARITALEKAAEKKTTPTKRPTSK